MIECVVRMEMPAEHCMDCHYMVSRDNDDCILQSDEANERAESWEDLKAGCPFVAVLPKNHGRLVDADAYFLGVIHLDGGGFANYNTTIAERLGEEDMRAVKVIVPAEK